MRVLADPVIGAAPARLSGAWSALSVLPPTWRAGKDRRKEVLVFYVTGIFTWAWTLLTSMFTALSTRPAAALLSTPQVMLYNNNHVPGVVDSVSNFTPCIFSGYANATVTLTGPGNLSGTQIGMLATASFLATTASPFVSDTAYGYILYDGASNYYGGELFPTPIPFAAAGAFLELDLVLPLNAQGINPVAPA